MEDQRETVGGKVAAGPGQESRTGKAEPRVYIGPGLRGVIAGTVFKGGLTPALENLVRDIPAAAELIVPVGSLAGARRDLADPESALAGIYREVQRKTRKKGE